MTHSNNGKGKSNVDNGDDDVDNKNNNKQVNVFRIKNRGMVSKVQEMSLQCGIRAINW